MHLLLSSPMLIGCISLVSYISRNIVSSKLTSLVGRNNLYAYQGRTAANRMAEVAIKEFQQDHNLTELYQTMLHGKWNQ